MDSRRLQDFKNVVDSTQQSVVHLQTQKRSLDWILSIANPNFSEIAFSVGYFHKIGSLEFSFQAIDELLVCSCMEMFVIWKSRNINQWFQIQFFRIWGWELTMLANSENQTPSHL
jgi:hypothetical protein